MIYASLEQRMAQSYIDMLPSFLPDENAPVSVLEQEQFYFLIKSLFQLASNEPLLFVSSLHRDDAYPSRFKKSYSKPQLIQDMRKFTKTIDALLQVMFRMGQGEQLKLNNRQSTILSRLGVDDLTKLPAAWLWMSSKEGANISTFSHCLFKDGYPYTSEIYARLLGASGFKKLDNWMLAQGYKRFDIYDTTPSDCNLSLSIVNPRWSGERPRGGFEYKIKHSGIAAQFDNYVNIPQVFGLCIPGGMKPYLEAFDAMEHSLRSFVIDGTKKCNLCKYCVQTDKSGIRPLATLRFILEAKPISYALIIPVIRLVGTALMSPLWIS